MPDLDSLIVPMALLFFFVRCGLCETTTDTVDDLNNRKMMVVITEYCLFSNYLRSVSRRNKIFGD